MGACGLSKAFELKAYIPKILDSLRIICNIKPVAGALWGRRKDGLTEWWTTRRIASDGGYGHVRFLRTYRIRAFRAPVVYILRSVF